ncbi:MAG: hypothetical protein AVDCRST_MAG70-790 [uncultured Thermomicrobiales bacterium]|uniref:Uncharacterized protein n=1 Tax=uncultured Thermomicrobiales bacterium TaxID=1645740 RepID=A0A6J4UFG6_9BACT|nr:MAG: hypothetical protein AVDCRST_MAG70-790 [uncultured Thermomicrobiales bacterium]
MEGRGSRRGRYLDILRERWRPSLHSLSGMAPALPDHATHGDVAERPMTRARPHCAAGC